MATALYGPASEQLQPEGHDPGEQNFPDCRDCSREKLGEKNSLPGEPARSLERGNDGEGIGNTAFSIRPESPASLPVHPFRGDRLPGAFLWMIPCRRSAGKILRLGA